jgi:RNA polymerase sigma-70 factor (ECF subfamily)
MTLGRSMRRLVTREADDAAVIEASHAEPDQFAIVFERHAPHIHRYLARRVGKQAADDLVAETFLVAFGKRRAYDARYRDARPWLYGIATILVGQHRRPGWAGRFTRK